MSMTLPRELQYSSLPSLPSGSQALAQSILPSNGTTFPLTTGTLVQFDLPSRGYLVPDSLYLRYKYKIV